jgi:fido (protein-threonine AMPylation protein)
MSGFEGFRDSPSAPFYRAGARSPDETWNEAARRLEKMIQSATAAARHRPIEISVEHIRRWHRGIFLSTFPREAGHIRADHEPAEFAIPIQIAGENVTTPMHGVLPHTQILARLSAACETFNAEQVTLQRRPAGTLTAVDGATPPAELYAAILEIHPFLDGNLRAAYVALQVGLASLGLPTVRFGHTIDRHDECLGWAMRKDTQRTIAPLAQLIVELAQ